MFWAKVSCGVKLANGYYKPTGRKREDAYVYRNANGFELSREKVDKIGWILGKAPEAFYGIPSKSLTPPQRGWKCYKGSKPAPTITYHKPEQVKEKTQPNAEKASAKVNQCFHRTRVYEEIIVTEETYVKKLEILVKGFLQPLDEEAYLPEVLKTMLHLCLNIQKVANDLLGYIHARIRERPSLVVSSAFIKYAPEFVCYTPYCLRFINANKTLGKLMSEDEKFRTRVNEISAANNNEGLDSLLIRPVQRMTKYHLFFQNLLQALDSSHPHREALQTALVTVKGICEQVNNDLSTAEESAVKLLEIYRILNGSCEDLVKPGRIFQMELDVQFRHRHSQPDDLKKLHAYVFSDLLVLSKPTPTLRNKNRQKMFLCFYHHSLTLEKAPAQTMELYLKNIQNLKDNTCVDRYVLRCASKDEFNSLCKHLDHLKYKQRTLSLKRHRGTARAGSKRGSLAAMEDKYRRNSSAADADTGSVPTTPVDKPRAWTRPRHSSVENMPKSRRGHARRWTLDDPSVASNLTPDTESTNEAPGRRKWASLRRGQLRSKKTKFTGTLDAQALKDLKAMSVRDKSEAAAAERSYTEEEIVRMSRSRRAVYLEIRKTEEEYYSALEMLITKYKNPLLEKKILTPEEGRLMFSNVEQLFASSKLLVQLLNGMEREKGSMSKVVIEAFKMVTPAFKGYSVYCKDYMQANEMIEKKLSSVSAFKKFVNTQQQKSKKNGKFMLIQDLVIKPVQRICKYPLFFQSIIKKTEPVHPMKKDLEELLEQIQTIANLVDARVKEYRERSKVVSVFRSVAGVTDDLLSSKRRFLKELEVEFGSLAGSSVKYSKSKLFVFTDRLMVAKESKALFSKTKSLRYKHQFNMVEIKISDYRDSPSELDITSVKTEGTVTVTKYRCRFNTISDKDEFKKLVETQQEEAFALEGDLQERKSKAVKTRTWSRKKRVPHVNQRLKALEARYKTKRGKGGDKGGNSGGASPTATTS